MVGINMAIAIRPARTFPLKLPFATFLLLSADDRLGRRAGHPLRVIRSTVYDGSQVIR